MRQKDMRQRAIQYLIDNEIMHDPNVAINDMPYFGFTTTDEDGKFFEFVKSLLKEYGVHRYCYEMWSEIYGRGCDKLDTKLAQEWGVSCAYCEVFLCDECPLKSCGENSIYHRWYEGDLEAAREIRDIAKEEMRKENL